MKSEKRPPSPDVIVLSDSEQPSSPRVNGLTTVALKDTSTEALLKSSPEERERMIKQLKEELRLEEAKLVLLKKLRQSQIQKEATAQKPTASSGSTVTTPPPLVRGTQNIPAGKTSLQTSSTRIPGSIIPPPLVRGGQQVSAKLGPQASSQVVMPPLVRGAQIHNIRQHSSTGPPPLLLAPRASVPSMQIQGQRIIQQGLIRVANVPNTSLLVNIPQPTAASMKGTAVASAQANSTPTSVASVVASAESPASRQAAAKLALRKQLEKTLLEIPPPKPPAPEMNFLPSAANNEFIYLVGLEEVVQNLLETQGFQPAVPRLSHSTSWCSAHFQPVTQTAECSLSYGPGKQDWQTFRESRGHRQGHRLQLEKDASEHRWDPRLRQPKLGSTQDLLGCGSTARIPPGHDSSTLHPPISHMEIVGAGPAEDRPSSLPRPLV